MSSDLDGPGLQAFLNAAGERYARRVREAETAKYRSLLAWLRWAWFRPDLVPAEPVPLAAGRIFVSETIEVPPGVFLSGQPPHGETVLALDPDAPQPRRRFLRDSRIGRRISLYLLLWRHRAGVEDEEDEE